MTLKRACHPAQARTSVEQRKSDTVQSKAKRTTHEFKKNPELSREPSYKQLVKESALLIFLSSPLLPFFSLEKCILNFFLYFQDLKEQSRTTYILQKERNEKTVSKKRGQRVATREEVANEQTNSSQRIEGKSNITAPVASFVFTQVFGNPSAKNRKIYHY